LATPEFWDYDTAETWLKKGRAPHEERPTKDAWNTKLVRVAPGLLNLATKDHAGNYKYIISFRKGHDTLIDLSTANNHVFRERINRYVAFPRGVKVLGTALVGQGPMLNGGESQVVLAENSTVEVNHLGEVPSPLNAPLPPQIWIAEYVHPYVNLIEKELKTGSLHLVNNVCGMCQPTIRTDPRAYTMGEFMRDPEHLFAHVFNRRYPAELLGRAIMAGLGATAYSGIVNVTPTETTFKVEDTPYPLASVVRVIRQYIEQQTRR